MMHILSHSRYMVQNIFKRLKLIKLFGLKDQIHSYLTRVISLFFTTKVNCTHALCTSKEGSVSGWHVEALDVVCALWKLH